MNLALFYFCVVFFFGLVSDVCRVCVYVGSGIWLGIELDKPSGKNNGSVGGVKYFSCPPKHGVFAPPSRVQRYVHKFSYTLILYICSTDIIPDPQTFYTFTQLL